MGLVDVRQPQSDEVLAARGWTGSQVIEFCQSGHRRDESFQSARKRGTAVAADGGGATLTCLAPQIPSTLRFWWLTLSRKRGTFTDRESLLAMLALRQQQVRFDHVPYRGIGRLLIGRDYRLVHTDPFIAATLVQREALAGELLAGLKMVTAQRWPAMRLGEAHDCAIEAGGEALWVCFHRGAAVDDQRAEHWYVELRRLEGELPAVGAIEDNRIAVAVAYLHDHFQESPSLAKVAQSVSVSAFHFHRLFSRHVGVSPKQYLQQKQLQVAKWLLLATRTPVGEIAKLTGFSSHGHFTSTFHRLTGMSPTEFRDR